MANTRFNRAIELIGVVALRKTMSNFTRQPAAC
jgi:hypothetical protein